MHIDNKSLREVFVDELKDLYSAEQMIIDNLPKMQKAASSPDLKKAFEQHLDMTMMQKQRLEQVFEGMQMKAQPKKCLGMEGILREGEEILKKDYPAEVKDAALIAAAQKVEHYEIASYGTVATFADYLGENDAARLLKETLDEEERTDKKLTKIAEAHINREASR